jgi:predicted metal-binding membrane protein
MPSSLSSPSPLLPRRDRITILSALIGVSVLAWAYVLYLWANMPGMDALPPEDLLQLHPWAALDFVLMFVMWAIMMVGMMLPSAAPMTLLYAGMARKAERQETPMAPTAAFVSGYLAIWCLFSVGATLAQWWLHQSALLSPMMVANSHVIGAGLLIVAGVYQLTPWKTVCLDHCRSPAHFISEHWRPGASGAFRLGLFHGAFCLGCCWALMGLLFVGGVMNLLWIAAIAIFVFLEKVLSVGLYWTNRLRGFAGIGLIVCGLGLLVWEELFT